MFDLFSFNSIEISRKTFEDIQGFRSMIEVDSVERIFDRFGEADVKDLRAINQEMRDAGTIASAAEADYAFHLRLVSILGNEAVSELYRIIKPVIMRIIERGKDYEEFASRVFCEHERILVALEARKRIDYQYALQTHLTMGLRNFGDSGGI
jgi:DNA-binding FadR family transcriptional regulator